MTLNMMKSSKLTLALMLVAGLSACGDTTTQTTPPPPGNGSGSQQVQTVPQNTLDGTWNVTDYSCGSYSNNQVGSSNLVLNGTAGTAVEFNGSCVENMTMSASYNANNEIVMTRTNATFNTASCTDSSLNVAVTYNYVLSGSTLTLTTQDDPACQGQTETFTFSNAAAQVATTL